jgi:hypothetical protein
MVAREARIDIIRGFSILVILINHLSQVVEFGGIHRWEIPTPTQFGYSTAAELFVMMSGYMVGLVYMARPHPVRAIWNRAATLWRYNAVLLAAIVPIALFMSADVRAFWRLDGFFAAPFAATFRFLTLQDAPRLLDILQLYMKLMLVAPLAILLHRRRPGALIPLSVGLYVLAQILTIRHVSGSPTANADGWLDLLSWQMLFFVPMALGVRRVHERLFRWLDGNRRVFAILAALFIACAIAKACEEAGLWTRPDWLTGRYGLHILRLSHAVLMLMLYASALALAGRFVARWPLSAVGAIGRHSLKCFAAGVIATYALGTAWERVGGGYAAYYLLAALGVALTFAVARRLESQRHARRTQFAGNVGFSVPRLGQAL